MKITVTSKDGVRLWTPATCKNSGAAIAATERELRAFAATQTAAELREDDYYDVAEEITILDPAAKQELAYGRALPPNIPLC